MREELSTKFPTIMHRLMILEKVLQSYSICRSVVATTIIKERSQTVQLGKTL
jgi:hypothetical protein